MTRRTAAPAVALGLALSALAGCTGTPGGTRAAADGRSASAPPRAMGSARPGAAARLPAVTLPPLAAGGARVDLARLAGTPTLVLLWGSYCEPCQREMPYFDAVAAAAGGRLRLLGVDTVDERDSARSFARTVGMDFPSVFDADGVVLRDLRLLGPPATVFVDPAGAIVHVRPGEYTSAAALRADVASYLHVRVPA